MSGVRSGIRCSSEGLQAGKVAVLEQLERGATTGGDVVDLAGEPEGVDGSSGVSAADDGEASGLRHRLGHHTGAGGEARILEHAHGAVPEDRAGLGDDVAELGGGTRTDVQALPTVGYVGAELTHLAAGVGVADLAAGAERGDVVGDVDG